MAAQDGREPDNINDWMRWRKGAGQSQAAAQTGGAPNDAWNQIVAGAHGAAPQAVQRPQWRKTCSTAAFPRWIERAKQQV